MAYRVTCLGGRWVRDTLVRRGGMAGTSSMLLYPLLWPGAGLVLPPMPSPFIVPFGAMPAAH
jgi:hypothetical protein